MEESFRQKFKEYFSFMKKDRNGVLVLMVLIVFTITGHFIVERIEIKPHANNADIIAKFEKWKKENETGFLSLFHFDPNTISEEQLDSLNLPQFVKNNIIGYRKAGGKFNCSSDVQKLYGMNDSIFNAVEPWLLFSDKIPAVSNKENIIHKGQSHGTFDPNTASADELALFGFDEYEASNLEKYRAKGGRFHSPQDIMKIYGVDSELFISVKEHIQINNKVEVISPKEIVVELNSADSLELIKLRGIGPVFAARIIKYRNLLGGYFSVEQLREVYGFPEDTYNRLKDNFTVDTLPIKKIRVNFAGYVELVRHPYIKKSHVEAILSHRDKHGPFSSEQQLLNNGLVDSVSFIRIKPYLTCR